MVKILECWVDGVSVEQKVKGWKRYSTQKTTVVGVGEWVYVVLISGEVDG